MSNPFAGIGLGELGREMSNVLPELTNDSPIKMATATLFKKFQNAVSPPTTNLKNDEYFKAHPVSSYNPYLASSQPKVPPVNFSNAPIVPSMNNQNQAREYGAQPGPTHFGPIHSGPTTPDPAHLQIDEDWRD